jgi:hypothetical protein
MTECFPAKDFDSQSSLGGRTRDIEMSSVVNFCYFASPGVSFWLPSVICCDGAGSLLQGHLCL